MFSTVISYRDAVRLTALGQDEEGFDRWKVHASNFLVFHTILRLDKG